MPTGKSFFTGKDDDFVFSNEIFDRRVLERHIFSIDNLHLMTSKTVSARLNF